MITSTVFSIIKLTTLTFKVQFVTSLTCSIKLHLVWNFWYPVLLLIYHIYILKTSTESNIFSFDLNSEQLWNTSGGMKFLHVMKKTHHAMNFEGNSNCEFLHKYFFLHKYLTSLLSNKGTQIKKLVNVFQVVPSFSFLHSSHTNYWKYICRNWLHTRLEMHGYCLWEGLDGRWMSFLKEGIGNHERTNVNHPRSFNFSFLQGRLHQTAQAHQGSLDRLSESKHQFLSQFRQAVSRRESNPPKYFDKNNNPWLSQAFSLFTTKHMFRHFCPHPLEISKDTFDSICSQPLS